MALARCCYAPRRWHRGRVSPPEVFETIRCQLGVAHGVLDVAVAEVGLKCPRVVPLVGQRVAAAVPQHVRVALKPSLASMPARSSMRANPAVVKGALR